MQIQKSEHNDVLVVTLKGRWDAHSSHEAAEELERALAEGWRCIELDMSELVYISSAGLGVLHMNYRKLFEQGGSLRIIRASEFVRKVIGIVGLSELLGD